MTAGELIDALEACRGREQVIIVFHSVILDGCVRLEDVSGVACGKTLADAIEQAKAAQL